MSRQHRWGGGHSAVTRLTEAVGTEKGQLTGTWEGSLEEVLLR